MKGTSDAEPTFDANIATVDLRQLSADCQTKATPATTTLERANLVEESQRAKVQIETERTRNALLSSISHDLKTPLALIRGYAETLRRTDVTWDRKTVDESLAVIQDEAEYLTNLVNALLDAAQLERGRLPLQPTEMRVDELARRMVERFQSLGEGHSWATEFPAEFPVILRLVPAGVSQLAASGGWIAAVHCMSPDATRSRPSSMCAVKLMSTISGKYSSIRSLTWMPVSVGTSRFSTRST